MTREEDALLAVWTKQMKVLNDELSTDIQKLDRTLRDGLAQLKDEQWGLIIRVLALLVGMFLPGKHGRRARARLPEMRERARGWVARRQALEAVTKTEVAAIDARRQELEAMRTEPLSVSIKRARALLDLQRTLAEIQSMPLADEMPEAPAGATVTRCTLEAMPVHGRPC
jgi:hypothetical protein